MKTEDAAVEAGVSAPVAFRWFRHAGGVNPGLPATVSGRYLSFGEWENVALWRAQEVTVREIARRRIRQKGGRLFAHRLSELSASWCRA